MAHFDNALICKNGHIINTVARLSPEKNLKFCTICGEKVLDKCETCGENILGSHIDDNGNYFPRKYVRPNCCHNCGDTHIWTIRNIEAVLDLLKKAGVSNPVAINKAESNLIELVRETPQMHLAAMELSNTINSLDFSIKDKIKKILKILLNPSVLKYFKL